MSNNLIKESKELIQSLSVIEERHLLELLAVYSGLKNVMRIHIANDKEYQVLSNYCKRNGMHLAHSEFRLKLSWTNDIGDQFYSDVPWEDDSAEEFIAYLTKEDISSLNRAVRIEIEGSHADAGKLYGYPDCCCDNYDTIANGQEWVEVLAQTSQGTFFSPWANKLAYLVHEFTLFPDYFPCSYACIPTQELSKQYFELGAASGLSDFVEMQLALMSQTYLVASEGVFSFSDWSIDDQNYLVLNLENLSNHGKNTLEEYPEKMIKILLPTTPLSPCFWEWEGISYRVFVFTDDPGIKH
jgi:hypothetical protein